MTFDEALDLFPDYYFDFVYLDGYAGNGFEGGQTLRKWSKKVKLGGVIAGDDYDEECSLLKQVVDEFVGQNDFELMVTEGAYDFSAYGHYPSWAVIKSKEIIGQTSERLVKIGVDRANSTKSKKKNAKFLDSVIRKVLPSLLYNKLRQWNRDRKIVRRIKRSKNMPQNRS